MDMPTVTDELPNAQNVRYQYLENHCEELPFMGLVQLVKFEMITNDGTSRSASLSVEDCRRGLEALE